MLLSRPKEEEINWGDKIYNQSKTISTEDCG